MSKVELEDTWVDVLGKAQRGLKLDEAALAAQSGLSPEDVRLTLGGEFTADRVRALAAALQLAPERVVALGEGTYLPEPLAVEGVMQFNTPFDDMRVNAYLVWDPSRRSAAVFDTGSDVDDLLAAVEERDLAVSHIFLTHAHGDHIYDLDRLREKTGAPAFAPEKEPVDGAESFAPGREFRVSNLRVETRLTWGHCAGGVTYVVRGLQCDLAICGDAMFAGSMGGGMISYAAALETNRNAIFSLADATVLCPGHGPMTTVGEQRRVNPFFPGM